jgi:flagellar biosynthetic protein FlhB
VAEIDKESRSLPPTPRRRTEARERGQVPRSREIATAAVIIACAAAGMWFAPALLARHREMLARWIELAGTFEITEATVPLVLRRMVLDGAVLAAPLVGAATIAGIGAHLSQGGMVVRMDRLMPNLERVNPLTGLKRMVAGEAVVGLLKAVVKLVVVGYVGYRIVIRAGSGAEALVALSVPDVVGFIGAAIRDTTLFVGAALLALAALDYGYEYYRVEQSLKMTRQEMEDEQRSSEGDVKIKRRFRKFHYELTKNRMLAEVPTADVVLTNPVHVAVALRYVADLMRAPRVVAKGAGEVAEQIKAAARRAGVPIVERRALARALFRSVKIGQEIPAALYRAVAEVLAYIYSLQRRAQAAGHAAGSGVR